MDELHSLPEALAAEIQQLATQIVPHLGQNSDERLGQSHRQLEPAIHRAMLSIAQSSPEVFASIMLAALEVDGIQVLEVHTTSEDQRVKLNNGNYHYSEIVPFVTTRTIRREARLIRPPRERRT